MDLLKKTSLFVFLVVLLWFGVVDSMATLITGVPPTLSVSLVYLTISIVVTWCAIATNGLCANAVRFKR